MKRVEVEFTDVEHQAIAAAAARYDLTVQQWVVLSAIGMVANRRVPGGSPMPRREPTARAPQYVLDMPAMVRCPNCRIMTRRSVSTCDNCEAQL